MKTVTFLSDFGMSDSYVAEVKGVLAHAASASVCDITHLVPPHQVEWGAFVLLRAFAHFPKGTWHLAVVDPGVGSDRRAVYIKTRDYHFVGPDNGLLRWAVNEAEKREKKKAQVFAIPIEKDLAPTFHGRDVFAPFIVQQIKASKKLKASTEPLIGRPFPQATREGRTWNGEILMADHYGNLITSVPWVKGAKARAELRGRVLFVAEQYASIPAGGAALIRGSSGFWEIACREDSAARQLGANPGTPLTLVSD